MSFKNHKDIPLKFRRVILDETLSKRVSKIPLHVCNEIINRHMEEEAENETLKSFQVEYLMDGKTGTIEVQGRQQALIEVDRLLNFGANTDPSVVIVVRQTVSGSILNLETKFVLSQEVMHSCFYL